MAEGTLIEIRLNGEVRQIPKGQTVLELLQSLNLPVDRVAVELNREILKRERWAETVIPEGAELEVVYFVGGGALLASSGYC